MGRERNLLSISLEQIKAKIITNTPSISQINKSKK